MVSTNLQNSEIISNTCFTVSECMTQGEIDKHLELGKQYLAKGQLGDALSQYHLAVGEKM